MLPGLPSTSNPSELMTHILLAAVLFFLVRLIKKIDTMDDRMSLLQVEMGIQKQDRKAMWRMIEDLEKQVAEIKQSLIQGMASGGDKH